MVMAQIQARSVPVRPSKHQRALPALRRPAAVTCSAREADSRAQSESELNRRAVVVKAPLSLLASSALSFAVSEGFVAPAAEALIPTTAVAGRVPGLSEPDERGWRTYRRPESKSGGHGVGWSELIPYSFRVPQTWEEVPVSIADLGGTEIDLRFLSSSQGQLFVVVAPVLRFSDGLGDDVRIETVGSPERVITAFGPELTGENVEGRVRSMAAVSKRGRTYYQYDLEPHLLVSATAAGNRMYILGVAASSRQWKKFAAELQEIQESFLV